MTKYEYKGRSKVVAKIPDVSAKTANKKYIINNCSFLLLSSYPMLNIKKFGCPLSNHYYDNDIMDLQLDLIQSVCKNPKIMIVGGFDVKRIFKHTRRNEFQVVENNLFEFTNSCEDLRIGLNSLGRSPTVVVDSTFIPSVETYKLLLVEPTVSKIIYSRRESDCIGVNITAEGLVNYFAYKCLDKAKGAYFLSQGDCDRVRKKCVGSSFNKSKFDYEILDELKIVAVEDNSVSLRLDENF